MKSGRRPARIKPLSAQLSPRRGAHRTRRRRTQTEVMMRPEAAAEAEDVGEGAEAMVVAEAAAWPRLPPRPNDEEGAG